jgi:class 3 adenylate cyclase
VVRAIGSDLRIDYTAVGETTHLAARMEQLARPGTALIAPATFRLAEGSSRGPRDCRPPRRGLTRFVGRDAETQVRRRSFVEFTRSHHVDQGSVEWSR